MFGPLYNLSKILIKPEVITTNGKKITFICLKHGPDMVPTIDSSSRKMTRERDNGVKM